MDKVKNEHRYMFSTAKEYLDALEDAQKTIIDDAKLYCLDSSNPIEHRIELFSKIGLRADFIYSPKNDILLKIVNLYIESDMCQKFQIIECADVIDWWMSRLKISRLDVDTTNKYHWKLIETKRNYEPSKEAIDKLFVKYINLVISENVSSFIFDW